MRTGVATRFLPAILIVASACADGSPPTAPDDAPILLDADLMSGGVGILESSDFTEFELTAAVDTADGGIVPNRWTNFAVRVDGAEVDSWRPDGAPDRIAFRVPLGHTGGVAIRATGEEVLNVELAARRLGLVATYRYDHDCRDGLYITDPDPFGPRAVLDHPAALRGGLVSIPTRCYSIAMSSGDEQVIVAGQAVLVPQLPASLRFVPDASDDFLSGADPERRTWLAMAGPTYVDGQDILERAAPSDSGPDIWRVRAGAEIEFMDPVSCPELPDVMFTLAELGPGLCLTFDRTGAVRRNGELLFQYDLTDCCNWPVLGFSVSSDGRSLLTGFHEVIGYFDLERLTPSSMPVFGPDGGLLYQVAAYREIYAALFSSYGDELLVIGWPVESEAQMTVIDRRDAATGDLVLRRERPDWRRETGPLGDPVTGARLVDGSLWVAWRGGYADAYWHFVAGIEVVDPQSLETLRSVAVTADPVPGYGTNVGLYPGTLILPDPSGRRATLVSRWDGLAALVGFTIDVYPES